MSPRSSRCTTPTPTPSERRCCKGIVCDRPPRRASGRRRALRAMASTRRCARQGAADRARARPEWRRGCRDQPARVRRRLRLLGRDAAARARRPLAIASFALLPLGLASAVALGLLSVHSHNYYHQKPQWRVGSLPLHDLLDTRVAHRPRSLAPHQSQLGRRLCAAPLAPSLSYPPAHSPLAHAAAVECDAFAPFLRFAVEAKGGWLYRVSLVCGAHAALALTGAQLLQRVGFCAPSPPPRRASAFCAAVRPGSGVD